MVTQLPSVFELIVGTRGRQRSTSSLSSAPTTGTPSSQTTTKDEVSSPSSIPRISSATSLPLAISNFGATAAAAAANGRKSSVHSIPEDPTSSVNVMYRRRTEPNIFPHQHYLHQHPQLQAQVTTSVGPPPTNNALPPQANTQTHLAPPPVFQHPSYGSTVVFSPLASGTSPANSTDYFTRNNQRSSISSSIDSLTRTNSSNGPLSLPNINGSNVNAQVYRNSSPKTEISPHQQHPHQPLQGLTAIPYQAEYFPVIYSSVPATSQGAPQSQVVYSMYPQPAAMQQYSGLAPPHQLQHPLHAQYHAQQLQHVQLPQQHHHQLQSGDENNALVNKRRIIKRRTRSGCLTCRKRRIKCDERKPHCFNCERSKKVCLGYENVPKKKPGLQESDEEGEAANLGNDSTGAFRANSTCNSASNMSTPRSASNSSDPIFVNSINYN